MSNEIRWKVVRESALTLHDHEAIAAMLGQAFPDWSHWYTGGRSWSGLEPELRIIARSPDDVVLAHLGIRRHFITIGDMDQSIASVGLVAVAPSAQGTGLGGDLLRQTTTVLAGLDVPFGFLGTSERVRPFYAHHGWEELDSTVVTFTAFSAEGAGLTVTDDDGWMILPVASTSDAWPVGPVLLNSQQV